MTWQLLLVLVALAAVARLAWADVRVWQARRTLVGRGILAPPAHPNCRCVIATGREREVYLRGGILDGEQAEYDAEEPPPRLVVVSGQHDRTVTYYRHDMAGYDDTKADGRPVYYAENLVKEDPWTESARDW